MLIPNGATLVLWLHILAAAIWIGGQIMLAALVPLLRPERALVSSAARRFAQVAWPAFAVLILTGIVNIGNAGIDTQRLMNSATGRTLIFKLVLAALSGLAAGVHSFVVGPRAARSQAKGLRALNGILGAVSFLAALGAALYGVTIAEQGD